MDDMPPDFEALRSLMTTRELDSSLVPDWVRSLSQMSFTPPMVEAMEKIHAIAGYEIPEGKNAVFLRFHSFCTNPVPSYIASWRANEKDEKTWYRRHVEGIDACRSAITAAHYHAARLNELESQVLNAIPPGLGEGLGNATIGMGCTQKLDYEYQAFILSYRRSLEYLTVGLCAYFKDQFNSFREFGKMMRKRSMRQPAPTVAIQLEAAHARHATGLAFVLEEGSKSVRNRIAHHEWVPAGCLNINRHGRFILGGGEEITPSCDGAPPLLSDVLESRLTLLQKCVDDMIDTFINAARSENTSAISVSHADQSR